MFAEFFFRAKNPYFVHVLLCLFDNNISDAFCGFTEHQTPIQIFILKPCQLCCISYVVFADLSCIILSERINKTRSLSHNNINMLYIDAKSMASSMALVLRFRSCMGVVYQHIFYGHPH